MIKQILKDTKVALHKEFFRAQWRKRNTANKTVIGEYFFNPDCVEVGRNTYGTLNIVMHSNKAKLNIGSYCSIASKVIFIVSGEHNTHTLSTYPFNSYYGDHKAEAGSKGSIVVNDDVWFGHGSIILSGITIGQGAVVSAGSLVTKDVPPYAIVGGCQPR